MMLQLFLLLVSTITLTNCWVINSNANTIAKRLTVNVTIECTYQGFDNGNNKLKDIYRMRIVKFDPTTNKWATIADLKGSNKNVVATKLIDADVTGHIGTTLYDTYIKIFFPVATDETVGRFKCSLDGYDVNDDSSSPQTQFIQIAERGVTFDDILKIITDLRKTENNDHADDILQIAVLKNSIYGLESKDRIRANKITQLTNDLNDVSNTLPNFSNKQREMSQNMNKIKQIVQNQYWPSGTYSIPSTSNGCPYSNTFNWQKSSIKISTKSGNNKDEVSSLSHLAGSPLMKNVSGNYVYMESCSKTDQATSLPWPKGKYCLQSYNMPDSNDCPSGFQTGWVTFDTFSIKNEIENIPHYSVNGDLVYLYYCCRDDGDVTRPILLPSSDPFYLYRFKGQCQEVIGMDVTEEAISFHTVGGNDSYGNDYHPDGELNIVKIELCYYKPSM